MQDSEWKEILDEINSQGFNHKNIIDRIKEKLLATEHQDIHRKWQRNSFDVNYLFPLQNEHIDGECTLLHLAASYGLKDLAAVLLRIGAKFNVRDQDDATPLHLAAKNGHIKVVKVLLQKGADPSLKNENGQTPINLAQNNNIRQLLQRAKKRKVLHSAILICMTVNLIVTLEVIMAMLNIAQGTVPIVIMPIMLIFTVIMIIALAITDCVIAHEALAFDIDEPNANEPSSETSEIQIEESRDIEISEV